MITLRNVYKTFNKGTINENPSLRGLSLAIEEGDFVTVIGSNGAGKSTLLNAIAGSLSIDSGAILIDELDVTKQPEHRRASLIGRVFQDPMVGTAAQLTIEENLALAMKRKGGRCLLPAVKSSYATFFREQLGQLGLGLEDRLGDVIGLLSGGQRQAITLLMAALVEPRIILLDEHTAALDPKTAHIVMKLSAKLIAEHKLTALMITHNLEHALRYGNRLVMLHAGVVAFDLRGDDKKHLSTADLFRMYSEVGTA